MNDEPRLILYALAYLVPFFIAALIVTYRGLKQSSEKFTRSIVYGMAIMLAGAFSLLILQYFSHG